MREIVIFLFVIILALLAGGGCATGGGTGPAAADTGDIGRLRRELESLRGEYESLQSDYRRLADESQFYAGYYRRATAVIESGLGELGAIGTDSAGEIQKLRGYAAILRSIVNSLIAGEQGKGRQDTQTDGDG